MSFLAGSEGLGRGIAGGGFGLGCSRDLIARMISLFFIFIWILCWFFVIKMIFLVPFLECDLIEFRGFETREPSNFEGL